MTWFVSVLVTFSSRGSETQGRTTVLRPVKSSPMRPWSDHLRVWSKENIKYRKQSKILENNLPMDYCTVLSLYTVRWGGVERSWRPVSRHSVCSWIQMFNIYKSSICLVKINQRKDRPQTDIFCKIRQRDVWIVFNELILSLAWSLRVRFVCIQSPKFSILRIS